MRADVRMVEDMVQRFPALARSFEEHISENFGEILPYLYLQEVADLVLSSLNAHDMHSDAVQILKWLETRFRQGNDEETTAIALGFLENLPGSGSQAVTISEALPSSLLAEYRRLHQ